MGGWVKVGSSVETMKCGLKRPVGGLDMGRAIRCLTLTGGLFSVQEPHGMSLISGCHRRMEGAAVPLPQGFPQFHLLMYLLLVISLHFCFFWTFPLCV